jgi:Resolvase, N terminal domain
VRRARAPRPRRCSENLPNNPTENPRKIKPRLCRLSMFSVLWNIHPAAGRGVTVLAKTKEKRVALYLRVSTSEQTTHNQRRELLAVAARHKWDVVGVFEDAGISGAKGRDQRPGLDAMMKVVARREVDMVAAWSVDHLGRSLIDLLGFLGELQTSWVNPPSPRSPTRPLRGLSNS